MDMCFLMWHFQSFLSVWFNWLLSELPFTLEISHSHLSAFQASRNGPRRVVGTCSFTDPTVISESVASLLGGALR